MVRMVLKEVLVLTAAGVALGLPVAWWLAALLSTQLYGVRPRDPASVALATLGLVVVSVLAGLVPALRASRLNPVSVLRTD